MNDDQLADELSKGVKRAAALAVRRPEDVLAAQPLDVAEMIRRDSQRVYEQVAEIQASERAARGELVEARARIEQYQRAEQAMTIKLEAAMLDLEVERRRTEKVREAFTALRVRMEGLGRLAADALAELREDET